MTYTLKTLGCKANLYDSQLIEKKLQSLGYEAAQPGQDKVSIAIINSCSVTNEADQQSLKTAKRFKKNHPGSSVILTGCSAEANPEFFQNSSEIDFLVGNRSKAALMHHLETFAQGDHDRSSKASRIGKDSVSLQSPTSRPQTPVTLGASLGYEELRSRHPIDREWPLPEEIFFSPSQLREHSGRADAARTRVFLKIQEGCNSFCTFCIIPYGRGPSRSLRPRSVLNQIQALVDQGVQEIVFTATNLGHYGSEWLEKGDPKTKPLDDLIESVLKHTKLKRLRLSSLDPTEISTRLMGMVEAESRLCPHFHVSLQSPHSKILKRMKRQYSQDEVIETLERIGALKPTYGPVYVGMDVITGFPGETDQIFEESLALFKALPWTRLHVFPYSERSKTPATRLSGSVMKQDRKTRAKLLRTLSNQRLKVFYQNQKKVNQISEVLLEHPVRSLDHHRQWWSGHALNYTRVLIAENPSTPFRSNQLIQVRPIGVQFDSVAQDASLLGELF